MTAKKNEARTLYKQVCAVAAQLRMEGIEPTVGAVHERTGGARSAVGRYLVKWKTGDCGLTTEITEDQAITKQLTNLLQSVLDGVSIVRSEQQDMRSEIMALLAEIRMLGERLEGTEAGRDKIGMGTLGGRDKGRDKGLNGKIGMEKRVGTGRDKGDLLPKIVPRQDGKFRI